MDRIPIYARGGAVIPDVAGGARLHQRLSAPRGRAASVRTRVGWVYHSMLQEDDGLTFAALHGARYRTTFTVARAGAELTLNADVSGDGYPEFARERFVLVLHGAAPEAGTARRRHGHRDRWAVRDTQ